VQPLETPIDAFRIRGHNGLPAYWSNALSESSHETLDAKGLMRRAAYDSRNAQPDKDRVSEVAVASLVQLPEYKRSATVLWYLDCRSELRTRHALPEALASGKRIVVPYCTVDQAGANKLGLWWLESFDELVVGKWKILEPPRERWGDAGKEIEPEQLDLVIVPGVAFSREGGRMGNGQGYYDRLLQHVRSDCPLVGLCYECQLFDDLIVSAHDVFMDKVVTERAVYQGRRRPSGG
jgi:5-formyltetrahydrofolate cyclo-ligase